MYSYNDTRFQCRGCGRFIKGDDIQHRTHRDPDTHYGVREEEWYDCPKCGPGQDYYIAIVGEYPVAVDSP